MKILIIKPSSLGDIVHTLPAVHMIRQAYPEATISWLVNDNFAGFTELSPDIDETIIFHRSRLKRISNLPEFFQLISRIRAEKFDIAIDFQGLFRSALIARLSNAPVIYGFKNAREGAPLFYNRKCELPAEITHAVDKNNFLAQHFIHNPTIKAEFPDLRQFEDFKNTAISLMDTAGYRDSSWPILALAPHSRWESKSWPPEFFAKVIDLVSEEVPVNIWLLGTSAEKPTGDQIVSLCRKANPANFMGKTNLGTMVELLRMSNGLLTNDSGPMHIAAALKVRNYAIFGPTDPKLTGPYGDIHRVFETDMKCRPCRNRICPRKKESRHCHALINPEDVAKSIIEDFKQLQENNKTQNEVLACNAIS